MTGRRPLRTADATVSESARNSPGNRIWNPLPGQARGLHCSRCMKNSSPTTSRLAWLTLGLFAACSSGLPAGDNSRNSSLPEAGAGGTGGMSNSGGVTGTGGSLLAGAGGNPSTGGTSVVEPPADGGIAADDCGTGILGWSSNPAVCPKCWDYGPLTFDCEHNPSVQCNYSRHEDTGFGASCWCWPAQNWDASLAGDSGSADGGLPPRYDFLCGL